MAQHVFSVFQPLHQRLEATQELQLFAIAGSSCSHPLWQRAGLWGPMAKVSARGRDNVWE
jgi:hypothetical protein